MTNIGPAPADALARVCERVVAVDIERCPLAAAFGRVLAERVLADRDSPPVDVSAMDGFALRAADAAGESLPIVGALRIGQSPPPLSPGQATRIVTGAPIPGGADAVLRHEDASVVGTLLTPARQPSVGEHIRRRGENARAGDTVLESGTLLHAPAIGALAGFGIAEPQVRRRVRVAIVTTGDELDDVTATPPAWRIRDGNGPALAALLSGRAWLDPEPPVRALDDEATLIAIFAAALARADALLVTGGVSMGERDHVPAALAAIGVRPSFHRLPQRPGKPLWGGATEDGRPVLGLPGNPLSVLVTARRFALPALLRRAGGVDGPVPHVHLDGDGRTLPLWWHRPVRLRDDGRAVLIAGRGSGDIAAVAKSDGFVELPPNAVGAGPWPYFAWRS